jgi:pyruvate/2-oxoglutarate dehydrogenase complex dihydrolipoamide dehydrogenase (E3) component
MSKWSHDIIIIGGGAAGLSAASGCSQLGMKTALIEPHKTGGDCLYHGCVPSKSLLKSASVLMSLRKAEDYGFPGLLSSIPTGGPVLPLDYKPVKERIAGIIGSIAPHDSPERFRSLGVEVIQETALFEDAHTLKLSGGRKISAAKMVLATGSRPRILPIPGLEEAGFITNIDIFSLEKLPASLAIIGGGPIGVEMGQAMTRLGVKVTIIEAGAHILPREDEDMAAIIRERLREEGVEVREGVGASGVSLNGKKKAVTLSDRSTVEAEEILMAAGRAGNSENLNVEAAGIAVERGFFKVDESLRTSARHIMAIGDCNGKFLFTHAAGAEASLVVRRLALHLPGKMNYSALPWVTYTEPELASAGFNEERAKADGLSYHLVEAPMSGNDRARAEGETGGKMKILYNSRKQIIGVQIAGPHAGEMLMPAVRAVSEKWKLGKLLGPIYPYPTVSEIYKSAAGKVLGPALFNERVRKILKFLFRYSGTGPVGAKHE